jgi:hypothetical protein
MKHFLIYTISFLSISCSNADNQVVLPDDFASTAPSYTIKLDSLSSSHLGLFFRQDGDGFAYFNKPNHSLDFLSEKGEPTRTLLSKDGPNKVTKATGFYISDSMIYMSDQFSLLTLNKRGDLINRYRANGNENSMTPNLYGFHQPHLINDNLFFAGTSYQNPLMGMGKNTGFIFKLDLQTGIYETMLKYPEELINGSKYSIDYYVLGSSLIKKDTLIVNFPFTETLYYSNNYKSWNKKEVKSAFQKTPIQPFREDLNDIIANKSHYMSNGIYTPLIDDPYRNIYYRIYSEPKETASGTANAERIAYLMICDRNLDILQEFKIPDFLSYFHFAVNPDGLFFKNFKDEKEDVLKMTRIYPY